MLPARHRLRDPADFRAVLRGPASARAGGALLVVHVAMTDARQAGAPRVGFAVSGVVGGSVLRHRTQRRLRHLVRDRLTLLPAGLDVVVRAQPAAAAATSGELGAELDRLLSRALDACYSRARRPAPAPAAPGSSSGAGAERRRR